MKKERVKFAQYLPIKYNEEDYLTDWEIAMRNRIDRIIKSELGCMMENEKISGQRVYRNNPIVWGVYYEAKNEEYEQAYRCNLTLSLLRKMGLDIEDFKETWMCTCERAPLVLRMIQDKLDGFGYDENGKRVQIHPAMDTGTTACTYEDGSLVIENGYNNYVFHVDRHQIITVNGENILNLEPFPAKEKEDKRKIKVKPEVL